jgi:hypothetical protein
MSSTQRPSGRTAQISIMWPAVATWSSSAQMTSTGTGHPRQISEDVETGDQVQRGRPAGQRGLLQTSRGLLEDSVGLCKRRGREPPS